MAQALTHVFCVLWPLHRKQELANSSDVTFPDRPLSPPLTAPPTMKVRGLELVSGKGKVAVPSVPGPATSIQWEPESALTPQEAVST